MLKIDPSTRTLSKVPSTSLQGSNILEREHLQAAIVGSWEAFCSELGQEELYLLGQEITPHDSCSDCIDILAIDGDGAPVILSSSATEKTPAAPSAFIRFHAVSLGR